MVRVPHVLIGVPLAATKAPEGVPVRSAGEAGNTEMSAPQSTRNDLPERRSYTDIVFFVWVVEPAAATSSGRQRRFPMPSLRLGQRLGLPM